METIVPRSSRLSKLAKFISTVTNPGLVTLGSLLYVNRHYADSAQEFWRWSYIGTGLLIVPGFAYTLWLWRKEGQLDVDISDRHDRIVPLMLTCLGALIGGVLIHGKTPNNNLELMSYVLVALLISLTIITLVWKISLHLTTAAALISLLLYFRGPELAYLYILLLPIGWARLRLKQHTPAQLVGGALIGIGVTLALSSLLAH